MSSGRDGLDGLGRRRLGRSPVDLAGLVGAAGVVWDGVCGLADALADVPWTVVGGQMVFLHAAEHDVPAHRVSTDIDAAVDVRADQSGVRRFVAVLEDLGFELAGASPDNHAYRFERPVGDATAVVDLSVTEPRPPRGDHGARPKDVDAHEDDHVDEQDEHREHQRGQRR